MDLVHSSRQLVRIVLTAEKLERVNDALEIIDNTHMCARWILIFCIQFKIE